MKKTLALALLLVFAGLATTGSAYAEEIHHHHRHHHHHHHHDDQQ